MFPRCHSSHDIAIESLDETVVGNGGSKSLPRPAASLCSVISMAGDGDTLSFDHLLTLAVAKEEDLRLDGWRGVLDRLAEFDGLQLQQIVASATKVLSEPSAVHQIVCQVVKKLGCRGEMERKLLMREHVPKSLITAMQRAMDDTAVHTAGLQALYPLAFDAAHRVQLHGCGGVPLCVSSMARHRSNLALQQHGCRFLQLMAFDDDCKTSILSHGGLPIVLDALSQYYDDKDLAISASDLLYFLLADLDGDDIQMEGDIAPRVVDTVVRIMTLHTTDARIQSHGVAILNSLVANDLAKPLLCADAVLDVVEHAIGFTDDATTDSIVLLFELFQDPACRDRLVKNACAATSRPTSIVKAIKAKLDELSIETDDNESADRVAFIQKTLAHMDAAIDMRRSALSKNVPSQQTMSNGRGSAVAPLPDMTTAVKPTSTTRSSIHIESPSKSLGIENSSSESSGKTLLDIAGQMDLEKCDPMDELNSNCFSNENSPTKTPPTTVPPSSNARSVGVESSPSARDMELHASRDALVEATKTIEFERAKVRKVVFNYKIMKRRLAEQHKLLSVHNERSVADAEIHEALLHRVQYLEAALEDAQKAWSAERATRVTLENEMSKNTVALASAQKALEEHQRPQPVVRMVPESKLLDAQRAIQQLTGDKLLLEEAVKVAQNLLYTCETNQFFLEAQLKQVRQEKLESLLMREEDVEIPKASKYLTLASPSAKRPQIYSPTPAPEPELTLELNDQQAIDAFLCRAYKCLEACSEGKGVHFSILRRYLVDSGVATPPVLPIDVDTILNKVLAVVHENKLKEKRRKDYEFSPCPQRPNFGKLRHRYFSRNLFCEAVTLVGAKKFPYMTNTTAMLREVILNYLNPYARAIESSDVHQLVTSYDPFNFLKIVLSYLYEMHHRPISTNDDDDEDMSKLRKSSHEPILQSMIEMVHIIQREQKPLKIICDFYTSVPDATKDDALDVGLEAVVNFAVDFEVIPAFLDRLAVKRLYKDILTYFKTFLAMYKGFPCPPDKKKYVSFFMMLARVAIEIFKDKREYDMPESQITGLLQWMDNSRGRGRIIRKGNTTAGIKFSNKLYAVKS
ncbi:hypothetical protein LEN26_010523 [Aphanomyces euteiches]|nr:hypothetical protein LEN26_010523 [Aphanomyces euteiches]KAH9198011.1 hypothetical protein AeNC1_000018 [Aphanomyces euteiches]